MNRIIPWIVKTIRRLRGACVVCGRKTAVMRRVHRLGMVCNYCWHG